MDYKFDDKGLIPAVIQDVKTKNVLMLGYMNQDSINLTLETKKVTFYSRSKQRIWVKGESSGNFLNLVSIKNDCDKDALLIEVDPQGPACHTGSFTCWGDGEEDVIDYLERTISERIDNPSEESYVSSLMKNGINKVAQKVGEEAIEVVIEAKDNNEILFLEESADLLFHFLILLKAKKVSLSDVKKVLLTRR